MESGPFQDNRQGPDYAHKTALCSMAGPGKKMFWAVRVIVSQMFSLKHNLQTGKDQAGNDINTIVAPSRGLSSVTTGGLPAHRVPTGPRIFSSAGVLHS